MLSIDINKTVYRLSEIAPQVTKFYKFDSFCNVVPKLASLNLTVTVAAA